MAKIIKDSISSLGGNMEKLELSYIPSSNMNPYNHLENNLAVCLFVSVKQMYLVYMIPTLLIYLK